MGILIGRLVGFLIWPVLLLGLIGLIQYLRTRDQTLAKRAMFSWWAISLAAGCLFLSVLGQLVQAIP